MDAKDFGNMQGMAEFLGRNNLWYYLLHSENNDSKLIIYTVGSDGKKYEVATIKGRF